MTLAMTGQSPDFMQNVSGLAAADVEAPWSRVEFAPLGAWVDKPVNPELVPAKEGVHLTHLLWERQVEVGTGRSFHATAIRLETDVAVQQESQWRLPFDPRTQRVTLHWLRVVRAGRSVDQLDRARMRLIQRETQLERLVIDGTWTLLTELEDVRPGDVLESAFSVETRHPIRGVGCEVFFEVPPQAVVGRYRLVVSLSGAGATPSWRASGDAPARTEHTHADGTCRWVWSGAQLTPRELEFNPPSPFLDHVWVQVSDLTNWDELAQMAAAAWSGASETGGLLSQTGFARPERVDAAEVNGLVERIQNDFRYFGVSLDAAGWIPVSPGLVARRRYGDGKDLVWLATCVLRAWGLSARPILVGTGLRGGLAHLLPMAGLLNHAVLEVEVEGHARWFDLTEKQQGGNFTGRAVGWFERGVAVEAVASALRSQPGERPTGSYALRETLLLDTTRDGISLVELRVRAEGWQADNLRRLRLGAGAEEFARNRETEALRRYGKVRRLGEVAWRDDRAANVCELVECFEIARAVYPDDRGQRACFDLPTSLVSQVLGSPGTQPRRGPWGQPFPSELRHEIEVRAASLMPGLAKRRRWAETEFAGQLDDYRRKGVWSKNVRFWVQTDAVSAERFTLYRKNFEDFIRETTGRIYLPWGLVRPHRPPAFGQLGPVDSSAKTLPLSAEPTARPLPTATPFPAGEDPKLARGVSSRRHHARTAPVLAASQPDRGAPVIIEALLRYGWILLALILLGLARGCSLPA